MRRSASGLIVLRPQRWMCIGAILSGACADGTPGGDETWRSHGEPVVSCEEVVTEADADTPTEHLDAIERFESTWGVGVLGDTEATFFHPSQWSVQISVSVPLMENSAQIVKRVDTTIEDEQEADDACVDQYRWSATLDMEPMGGEWSTTFPVTVELVEERVPERVVRIASSLVPVNDALATDSQEIWAAFRPCGTTLQVEGAYSPDTADGLVRLVQECPSDETSADVLQFHL
jgi:hypothetical protein